MKAAQVTLVPWAEKDLPLLEQLMGDAKIMQHLGGIETPEQIRARHQRYLRLPETDHMFTIVLDDLPDSVGSIGYWQKDWRDQLVYEMGWFVLPANQGRGVATKAGEAILALARADDRHQFMHAFPSITNPASNAICRKLGFTLFEECAFEYPPGNPITVNDWRLDLFSRFQF
jgi:RimJ/RimL family protein N-acetyltransferase